MINNTPSQPRIALVTGASRRIGIGTAICRALAAQGMDVAFTYWQPYDAQMDWGVDQDAPTQLTAELQAIGVRCLALEADLSQPDTPTTLLNQVEQQLGAISVLVNNATYSTTGDYEQLDAQSLDAHYAVNIRGTFLLSVEFARRFQAGHGGRIINMTSGQSLGPMQSELAYASTKGAVEAFTLSLAAGVAKRGITVNAVDPGPTDTGWMKPELKAILSQRTPSGRVGLPEDAAKLIGFLASEDSEWVTGQIIHSNGGFGWA
ncbi:MAG: SDR family oxidoreductase [Chloroflexota bacterium]